MTSTQTTLSQTINTSITTQLEKMMTPLLEKTDLANNFKSKKDQ